MKFKPQTGLSTIYLKNKSFSEKIFQRASLNQKSPQLPLSTYLQKNRNSSNNLIRYYLTRHAKVKDSFHITINANDYFAPQKKLQFASKTLDKRQKKAIPIGSTNRLLNTHGPIDWEGDNNLVSTIDFNMINFLNAKARYSKSVLRSCKMRTITKDEYSADINQFITQTPVKHKVVLKLPMVNSSPGRSSKAKQGL